MTKKQSLHLSLEVTIKNKIKVHILENYHYDPKSAGWLWDTEHKRIFTQDEMIKVLMDSGLLKEAKGITGK